MERGEEKLLYLETFKLFGIEGLEEVYVENSKLIEDIVKNNLMHFNEFSIRHKMAIFNAPTMIYHNFQKNLFLLSNLRTISQKKPKIYNTILKCVSDIFLSEEIHAHFSDFSITNSFSLLEPSKILKISLLYYLYSLIRYERTFKFSHAHYHGKEEEITPIIFIEDYLFNFFQDKDIPRIFYVNYLFSVVKLVNIEEDIVEIVESLLESFVHEDLSNLEVIIVNNQRINNNNNDNIDNKNINNNNDNISNDDRNIMNNNIIDNGNSKIIEELIREQLKVQPTFLQKFNKIENIHKIMKLGYDKELQRNSIPLSYCVNNFEIIKLLIEEYHAKYDDENFQIVIETACIDGQEKVVRYLIECYKRDGKLEKIRSFETELLFYSSSNGHLSILKYFIEEEEFKIDFLPLPFSSQNESYHNESLVTIAALNGHRDVVNYLLEIPHFHNIHHVEEHHLYEVKIYEKEKFNSPVISAMTGGHFDLAFDLLERKYSMVHRFFQRSFLNLLIRNDMQPDLSIVSKFISLIDKIDVEYLLLFTFKANSLEVFKWVLDQPFMENCNLDLVNQIPNLFFRSAPRHRHLPLIVYYFERYPVAAVNFHSNFIILWERLYSFSTYP